MLTKDNIKSIELNKLIVNLNNPRFHKVKTELEAIENIVKNLGDKLLRLAKDIVDHGLNPIDLPLVTPDPEKEGYYIVEEGNRRITALKLLLNPDVIVHHTKIHSRFKQLHQQINPSDFYIIDCVVIENENEINHWIELKHTGENFGAGTVPWNREQLLRFEKERLGKNKAVLQLIDFLKSIGYESHFKNIYTSNLSRLIDDPDVRDFLGLKLENKILYTNIPLEELLKGLNKIVNDLSSGDINVKDIYYKHDRIEYLQKFDESQTPDKSRVFSTYIPLNELISNQLVNGDNSNLLEQGNLFNLESNPNQSKGIIKPGSNITYTNKNDSDKNKFETTSNNLRKGDPKKNHTQSQNRENDTKKPFPLSFLRKTLIPKDVKMKIDIKRINYIYKELQTLNVDEFPNCAAVLFRVFFELSVDAYIKKKNITDCNTNSKLVVKVKRVSEYMENNKILTRDELKPVNTSVSSQDYLGSTNTLNAYVHNSNMQPLSKDLKTTWDNMEKFIKAIWK